MVNGAVIEATPCGVAFYFKKIVGVGIADCSVYPVKIIAQMR
jgi:hypothetical protein